MRADIIGNTIQGGGNTDNLTHDEPAWAWPNGYYVAGLDIFARALAAYGHPRSRGPSRGQEDAHGPDRGF